jgi:hypothetical protein
MIGAMEVAMATLDDAPFLRRILLADAVISGAMGLLMALGAETLEVLLGVPASLLRSAGVCLVPFAIVVGSLSRREALPRGPVRAVIAMNAAWVAASAALLLSGMVQPNAVGYAFIVGQAVVVAVLAEMQYAALRGAPLRAA